MCLIGNLLLCHVLTIERIRKTKSLKRCHFLSENPSHPFNHQLPPLTFIYQIIFLYEPFTSQVTRNLALFIFFIETSYLHTPFYTLSLYTLHSQASTFANHHDEKGRLQCSLNIWWWRYGTNFHRNFFIRPIGFGRSFAMEKFSSLPQIVEIF